MRSLSARRAEDARGRFVVEVPDEIQMKVEIEIEDDEREVEIELTW